MVPDEQPSSKNGDVPGVTRNGRVVLDAIVTADTQKHQPVERLQRSVSRWPPTFGALDTGIWLGLTKRDGIFKYDKTPVNPRGLLGFRGWGRGGFRKSIINVLMQDC